MDERLLRGVLPWQREEDELAREGYQFYAAEAEEFAETTMRLAQEVLDDDCPTR